MYELTSVPSCPPLSTTFHLSSSFEGNGNIQGGSLLECFCVNRRLHAFH